MRTRPTPGASVESEALGARCLLNRSFRVQTGGFGHARRTRSLGLSCGTASASRTGLASELLESAPAGDCVSLLTAGRSPYTLLVLGGRARAPRGIDHRRDELPQ